MFKASILDEAINYSNGVATGRGQCLLSRRPGVAELRGIGDGVVAGIPVSRTEGSRHERVIAKSVRQAIAR